MTQPPAFDPRQVPVEAVDQHLPAVPAQSLLPQALVQRFARGHSWSPELRGEPRFTQRPPVEAAVLIPLVERSDGLTVLLTQRTANLSSHSGQIAFPGGKSDPQDAHAQATALREAQEEINLDPGLVRVIGNLSVYTTGSAYIVTGPLGSYGNTRSWTLGAVESRPALGWRRRRNSRSGASVGR